MDLSERKLQILQAIIGDFIKTGEPVGSRALSKKYNLGVSPATIRNEMSDLEDMGYLSHIHTSSGRVPSDKAYRLYVNELMEKRELLLFSHQLTDNQAKELMEDFGVKKIVSLTSELQEMWSNVSIKKNYMENLKKIKEYIKNNFNKNDVMLIQGNWGYTYNLVKWSIDNELIPVYSYTERNVEEIKDGENVKKISYFKHIKFIEYE